MVPVKPWLYVLMLWLVSWPLLATQIESNRLSADSTSKTGLQYLYYLNTTDDVSLDDILADPAYSHSFQPVNGDKRILISDHQPVWFKVRLRNTTKQAATWLMEYNFPMVDKLEVYQVDRASNNIELLNRTGNDYPFSERALPYRGYVTALNFEPEQEFDLYLRVEDAAIIPGDITLWQSEAFISVQQGNAIFDGVLSGILLMLALHSFILFYQLRQRQRLYQGLFFGCFAMVLAILNGLAFPLFWPDNPAINLAVLYIFAGLSLLCLNLFIRARLEQPLSFFWHKVHLFNNLLTLSLLFSPLLIDGEWRFWLLLGTIIVVLGTNILLTLHYAIAGQKSARSLALACFFLLMSAAILTMAQLGYFKQLLEWHYLTLLLILLCMTVIHFSLDHIHSELTTDHQTMLELTKYKTLFHQAAEGLFVGNAEGKLLDANLALLQILGYQQISELRQDVGGHGMTRFYANPNDRQDFIAQLHKFGQQQAEIRGLRADRSPFWALLSARLVPATATEPAFIHGSVIDISKQKLAYEQLSYQANHDAVTGLYNRHFILQQLTRSLYQGSKRNSSLLFIDIAQFNDINNRLGHSAGDSLLKQLGQQLAQNLAPADMLARLEKDQFALLSPGKNANEALVIAYRLVDQVKQFKFNWQQQQLTISINIGIRVIDNSRQDSNSFLIQAAAAAASAREKGQNRIHLYTEPMATS
ncbi:diguanylate cyclase domain-containing protein [Arsukibacterium indicum]|uniref:Diguanylate cyclase n=1 Tax=Arsukibacterium indicum TaxID=2848612 RepID=A0ABS6MK10_9GAMM|nr:diguanylate cyclase [Arsukibacterium indicum]MBV2129147.1 diguanylate cyclase [Arsukibacterium indicum]